MLSDRCDRAHFARRFRPAWGVLIFVALAVVARFGLHSGFPFPQCWLRKLTGVPCPSCGCTRSLAAWANLDFQQALQFNPLFFMLCVGALLWFGAGAIETWTGRRLVPNWRSITERWPVWRIAFAAMAVNWLYLCLKLPG
jgi:hypothetical protein